MNAANQNAIAACRRRLAENPRDSDTWYNLGYWLRCEREFEPALEAYRHAIDAGLNRPEEAHVNRAAIFLDHLARPAEAGAELLAALEAHPDFLPALTNLGQLYEDVGNVEDAAKTYRRILRAEPSNGRAIGRLSRMPRGDENSVGIPELNAALELAIPGSDDAAEIEMALGQMHEAAGLYEAAFEHYTNANAIALELTPSQLRYKPNLVEELVRAEMDAFRTAPAPLVSSQSGRIVFICGMLRSGSTLTERILAQHPRIASGGELEAIPAFSASLPGYPSSVRLITGTAIEHLRGRYMKEAETVVGPFDVIVDKRPDNFLHIGLIKTIFPDAKIVNTVRDRGDTMVSIYANLFGPAVPYAHKISDIAHWQLQHDRMMSHWRALWPGDILTLDYGDLVSSPEATIRALLEHCGLEWDEACLAPPSGRNFVRTLSQWQVREPIHDRSVGRARPFLANIQAQR